LKKGEYLYGLDKPDLEIAMKTFSHELKGASQYFNVLEELKSDIVPAFQMTVDYKGLLFRSIAFGCAHFDCRVQSFSYTSASS
jgi:hypothetical protein